MFKCEIKTGNAAYRDEFDDTKLDPTFHEIKRNLMEIISKLDYGYTSGSIIDINGNKVGNWKID